MGLCFLLTISLKYGMKINDTFSKLSNINLILNFKQNVIEDFYQQNKCFNSNPCYVCKRIEETKDDYKEENKKI